MSDQDNLEQRQRIEALTDELRAIRHDIHKHPETAYEEDRKSTRLNSSHSQQYRMPSSA